MENVKGKSTANNEKNGGWGAVCQPALAKIRIVPVPGCPEGVAKQLGTAQWAVPSQVYSYVPFGSSSSGALVMVCIGSWKARNAP